MSLEKIEINNIDELNVTQINCVEVYKKFKFTTNFLRKYKNFVDWNFLSRVHNFSQSDILEVKNFINWEVLIWNKNVTLTEDFLESLIYDEEFQPKNYRVKPFIIPNDITDMSEIFKLKDDKVKYDKLKYANMTDICVAKNLSEAFIKKHIFSTYHFGGKVISLVKCFNHQKLSENFIEDIFTLLNENKNEDIEIYWETVSSIPLSESFIEKHKDELNWYNISRYQKLSEEFIDKFCNNNSFIYWNQILINENINLSSNFIEKHFDKMNISIEKLFRILSNNEKIYNKNIKYKFSKEFLVNHIKDITLPDYNISNFYEKEIIEEYFLDIYKNNKSGIYCLFSEYEFSKKFLNKYIKYFDKYCFDKIKKEIIYEKKQNYIEFKNKHKIKFWVKQ